MTRQLVQELLTDENPYLEKSLINYKVKGLHRIVLDEVKDRQICLYVTDPDHEMWKNNCGWTMKGWKPLSLPISKSTRKKEIIPLHGFIWKANFTIKKAPGLSKKLKAFKFDPTSGFIFDHTAELTCREFQPHFVGRKYFDQPGDLRTFYVTKHQSSAWVEIPGETVIDSNICYSNDTLQYSEDLFQTMTRPDLVEILKFAKFQIL